jgi:16S rRNA (guanine527-N7)-methyltransferase
VIGADERARLLDCLRDARQLGFLGPGPVEPHLEHALAHCEVARGAGWADRSAEPVVADLGSGGGVPGLVLAVERPRSPVTLIESGRRRVDFLRACVERLGLECAEVYHGRAESYGRDAGRGRFDVVTARSVGPPAVTAELGAPLLALGGKLVVSAAPDAPAWPQAGAQQELGLGPARLVRSGGYGFVVAVKIAPTAGRYPRRAGVPAKRPLW